MPASAALPLQKALVSRITAALTAASLSADVTANPQPGRSYPYVVVGEDDENDTFRTANTGGAEVLHTVRVWSDEPVEAKQMAAAIIDDLTDRSNPPMLDSPHVVVTVDLTSSLFIPTPRADGDFYQVAVRLRYQITQGLV